MKATKLTRDTYMSRYVKKIMRLISGLSHEKAEDYAETSWHQHWNENFKHLETPEKDAEVEYMYVTKPKDD